MAIDLTNKALNMAVETMNAAVKVMEGLETLQALEAEREKGALTLSNFDTAFGAEDSGIKHINGVKLDAVLFTSTPAILAWMIANNHIDNFQAVRP